MSTEPLISVIIPVYNAGALLCQSLDSLLNQTFRDWEAVCVDDGSIDGSADWLDEYAERDSRIKVVHKLNGGVSSARNCGLEHASAPYITMLDADDYFAPTALEELYSCMHAHDCDVVCCTMRKVFEDGHTEDERARFSNGLHKAAPADIYRFAMRSPCCKLYKHSILNREKIRFPLGIPICEDDVFVVSYWYHVKSFYMLDKPLYNYVQSESSVLKKLGEGRLPLECYMATLDVPVMIYRYIQSKDPSDELRRTWATLLFKSQCHIGLWMLECNINNDHKLLLSEKNRNNKKEIRHDVSSLRASCMENYIGMIRKLKSWLRKICLILKS